MEAFVYFSMAFVTFGVAWYALGKSDMFEDFGDEDFFEWILDGLLRCLLAGSAAAMWPVTIAGGILLGAAWLVWNARQPARYRKEINLPWSGKYQWKKENNV